MRALPDSSQLYHPGQWLPSDHRLLRSWVQTLIRRSPPQDVWPLHPVLRDFKDAIETHHEVRRHATRMFEEVPVTPPYNRDPMGGPQVRDYNQMLELINTIIHEGPQWNDYHSEDNVGDIGFPIFAILNWPMGTRSGYAFFTNKLVNAHFKRILDEWKTFLMSPASQAVLNSHDGWTSKNALEVLTANGNVGIDAYTFTELYVCPNPSAPGLGFHSWDAFFTREFQPNIRPVADPESNTIPKDPITTTDPTRTIVHACESTPYARQENVQLHDTFWLKHQPYSLAHMLNSASTALPFVGGQVYQAYLSAHSYHRWHAPVSGTVRSTECVRGTYYSENYYQGFANADGPPDSAAPNNSQRYIAEVATRAIIVLEADNKDIGLLALVFVGMCEVSSCEVLVRVGERVRKGMQIGMFHYGGSSHCLVFRPETRLEWGGLGGLESESGSWSGSGSEAGIKKVCSRLATVV